MTKGAFFHHFKSKEALGVAAAEHWATSTSELFAAALQHGLARQIDAQSRALHSQAVLQGAFILAKATGDVAVARDSTAHLKLYFQLLFTPKAKSSGSSRRVTPN